MTYVAEKKEKTKNRGCLFSFKLKSDPMKNIASSLHSRVHTWIDAFGFRLNEPKTRRSSNIITRHYFFETFNFFEKTDKRHPGKFKFLCFDMYGEKIKVNTLLDLQAAFFENISQLK